MLSFKLIGFSECGPVVIDNLFFVQNSTELLHYIITLSVSYHSPLDDALVWGSRFLLFACTSW